MQFERQRGVSSTPAPDRQGGGAVSEERCRFLLSDAILLVAAVALMLSADRAVHGFWVWGDPVASYGPTETRRMAWSFALAGFSLPLLGSLPARRSDRGRLHLGAPGLLVHLAVGMAVAVRLADWAAQA